VALWSREHPRPSERGRKRDKLLGQLLGAADDVSGIEGGPAERLLPIRPTCHSGFGLRIPGGRQCGIPFQDSALQRDEFGAGLDAELFTQSGAGILEGVEGGGKVTTTVEG
jgi:hypothetical protein